MLRRIAPLMLAAALPLVSPSSAQAQEGSIAYTHSVEFEFEIPEEIRARLESAMGARGGDAGRGGRGGRGGARGGLPQQRTSDVLLIFNATESLMKQVPRALPEGRREAGANREMARRAEGFMARMRMSSANRADRETLQGAHTNYAEGTVVEAREFLGRTFIIEDQRPSYEWKLSGEQAEFLGYVVQKATAVQDSTTIEAWFTPQIPVMGGPGPYGGLPGMILVVSVNDGKEQYTATSIAMSAVAEDVIVRPTDGEEVSREEYEQIVEEKLEELRMTQRRGRGG